MKRIALLIPLLLAVGCTSKVLPGEEYVKGDRETYIAVEPFLRDQADASPDDADAIDFALRNWDRRITAAENAYAETPK